ncbi:hypothetical protein OG533_21460 [Streptomyces sp. NBC_01186]|uniref:hypothetical protein n=1 Tax=Streptomyces sp. NBC_01186 TaxID=2903765 RepID=UPI002E102EC6|nr:hypothetical protein OG533_21460 [Streptomyces sp. NBC_01186]
MPRGRHRHSPPLHRLLAPATVAAVSLACAGGAWLIGERGISDIETVALRALAAGAALAAVTGAVLLRRWDYEAGRRVGDLKAQQASTAWRTEEKQAELEGEAEEQREIRAKLDTKLRSKRAELARLRTEHAALLRRYAHAETERASALEGRRQLEIEAAQPTKALTAAATDHRHSSGAPTPLTYLQADEALNGLVRNAARQREADERREREERIEREKREAEHRARTSAAAAVPPQPEAKPKPAPEKDGGDGGDEKDRAGQSADPDGSSPDTGGFDFFGSKSGAASSS